MNNVGYNNLYQGGTKVITKTRNQTDCKCNKKVQIFRWEIRNSSPLWVQQHHMQHGEVLMWNSNTKTNKVYIAYIIF